jgi:pSer/pThr/pTyr-binding forkhead associated (FHA) protein
MKSAVPLIGRLKTGFFASGLRMIGYSMPFALQFFKDNSPAEILPVTSEGVTLGRSSGHILFEDVEVSGLHCTIKYVAGELVIVDHGSRNGTFVNGSRVEKSKLKVSDIVQIGEYRFRVVEWPAAAQFLDPESVVEQWIESFGVERIDASQKNMIDLVEREIQLCIQDAHIRLKFVAHNGRTEEVTLPRAEVTLGRAASIPCLLHDEELSRKHARLSVNQQGRLVIEDLDSANGTFVNDERLYRHRVLTSGDCVRIGKTQVYASLVIPEFVTKASP